MKRLEDFVKDKRDQKVMLALDGIDRMVSEVKACKITAADVLLQNGISKDDIKKVLENSGVFIEAVKEFLKKTLWARGENERLTEIFWLRYALAEGLISKLPIKFGVSRQRVHQLWIVGVDFIRHVIEDIITEAALVALGKQAISDVKFPSISSETRLKKAMRELKLSPDFMYTTSGKIMEKLVEDGFLEKVSVKEAIRKMETPTQKGISAGMNSFIEDGLIVITLNSKGKEFYINYVRGNFDKKS